MDIQINNLILTLLSPEKPADEDPHCFHPACKYMLITGVLQVNWMNIVEVHNNIQHDKG